jgi:hypothetical protein
MMAGSIGGCASSLNIDVRGRQPWLGNKWRAGRVRSPGKITKQAVKKTGTKKAAPARRAKTTRAKRPSVAVVVLSGSTPLRRNKAAELVAEELQLDLAKVNLASVVSRQVGETEKNINRVFDEAERSGAILFFDGADALFGTGRAGKDGASHSTAAGGGPSAATHRGPQRPGHSHDQREKPDRSSLVAASEGVRDGGHQEEAKEEVGLTRPQRVRARRRTLRGTLSGRAMRERD